MFSNKALLLRAKELGLFDFEWYKFTYKIGFNTEQDAFDDYLRKSTFADVQPSANFDGMKYLQLHNDAFVSGTGPLRHYIETKNRAPFVPLPHGQKWKPAKNLTALPSRFDDKAKYAITLHIYYEDFIKRFHDALIGLPFNFDLFITIVNPSLRPICEKIFKCNNAIQTIEIREVPNRGRNFGPLLVEFGEKLLDYDFFLHLHSKKSLYSGKEQLQWADFLIEYLAKDKQVISQAVAILSQNSDMGLYYPTSYWNLPPWVNHWLKNKGLGKHTLAVKYEIDHETEFFAYPVGGMFWARPDALKEILARGWSYEDFPIEPISADGTELHVLERILPFIARKNRYNQFFYDPASASFSSDETFVFKSYQNGNLDALKQYIAAREIISFDVFDTIVKRDFVEPDLAKYILADKAGLKISSEEFVKLRNRAELDIRIESQFRGDVSIYDIYERLIGELETEHSAKVLADLEFYIDYEMLNGKQVLVDLVNDAHDKGKRILFVTDTYYLPHHIDLLLEKAGISCPYELHVSSHLGLRKDNGTMWTMLNDKLTESGKKGAFLHIGDSVCSDAQNPGDLGLNTFHILHPMDKWEALGLPRLREKFNINNIDYIRKWGPVVAEIGSNPFL